MRPAERRAPWTPSRGSGALQEAGDLGLDVLVEPGQALRTAGLELTGSLAENQVVLCRAIAKAGLNVAFFESAAAPPILSPRQFQEVELPALKRVLALAADCIGRPVPCIMGGNTFPILDAILSTGTNYLVCNVETNQAMFVERVSRTHPHVMIRVNLDPGVVACSEPQPLYRGIDRVLEIAGGRPNCLMGTGAMPYETPLGNIRLIREYLANHPGGQAQVDG